MARAKTFDTGADDIAVGGNRGAVFVTIGEPLLRETPADFERPERTRHVHLSVAGSEYSLAMGLARLNISASYVTRLPDNPYGRMVRNVARENGVITDHITWAPAVEPLGRFIYEIGRTPRKNVGVYQRMFSAASKLGPGTVDWASALAGCRLFHTSGITLGLATHSRYEFNYLRATFEEAVAELPTGCMVGLDFNYRNSLWSPEEARSVMTPVLTERVDVLITSVEDMAKLYGMGCGQYTADQIDKGEMGQLEDDDLRAFIAEICERFETRIAAVTIRYPDNFEQHRWESAAGTADGSFSRSTAVRQITLQDRLGGGDAWNAGFYYGLLASGFTCDGIDKGIIVGDAATRIKQTLMFDLPIISLSEIEALLTTDRVGGGKRTSR